MPDYDGKKRTPVFKCYCLGDAVQVVSFEAEFYHDEEDVEEQ